MIGFFKFDEKPNTDKQLVLAHSSLNGNIKGYFYVKQIDGANVSNVDAGSEFFGVLDDSSGYGACLFIKDLDVESDSLLLQHNLHVKGDTTVDGNTDISGNLHIGKDAVVYGKLDAIGNITTSANIVGNSPNTMITLDSTHTALIVAMGLTGAPAPLIKVPVIMNN